MKRLLLDLSTAHLPEALCGSLGGWEGVTAYRLPYGWLLHVPGDVDTHVADYEGPPAEVVAIWRHARAHDCDYVLLDRDGDTDPDLPTWDW